MYVSTYGGLGANTAERIGLCESGCASAGFGQPNRNNKIEKCVTACRTSLNSGNCDGRCNPVFNTNANRTRCTSACKWTFGAPAGLLELLAPVLDVVVPVAPNGVSPDAPGAPGATRPFPWKFVGIGAAVVAGIVLIARRRAS